MKLNQKNVGILIVVMIFGGILASDALGLWRTESSKVPVKIQEGDFAGLSDPTDIRGSYTFADIERTFPITVEVLADAFRVTEEPEAFQLKKLEENYPSDGEWEMGTASVRYFVARYTGLPYESTGEEALFPHAIAFLVGEGKISAEEAELIPVVQPGVQIQDRDQASQPEEHIEPLVKGNTTIADLFSLGLSEEEIVAVTGKFESKGELVRDVCRNNGLSFSEVKTVLIEKIEANQ